jgi:hypothetical protein
MGEAGQRNRYRSWELASEKGWENKEWVGGGWPGWTGWVDKRPEAYDLLQACSQSSSERGLNNS